MGAQHIHTYIRHNQPRPPLLCYTCSVNGHDGRSRARASSYPHLCSRVYHDVCRVEECSASHSVLIHTHAYVTTNPAHPLCAAPAASAAMSPDEGGSHARASSFPHLCSRAYDDV